ncbi:MAG: helix-turn-helix transcriptional regulator [Clostridia bacterium]|nr:helix-turn-helix transcriptional regulator [Clostridia bacterium]
MAFRYKINILSALKDAGYNTNRIRKEKILGEYTLQSFRCNRMVSWETLNWLCTLFNCQPGDLLEFVPDDTAEESGK